MNILFCILELAEYPSWKNAIAIEGSSIFVAHLPSTLVTTRRRELMRRVNTRIEESLFTGIEHNQPCTDEARLQEQGMSLKACIISN